MQQSPEYLDVIEEVGRFLLEQAVRCEQAGIQRRHLLLDPGFGFGKRLEHNLSLLKHLSQLVESGYPVLVGMSRKSMIGAVLGQPVEARLHGSVAAATLAAWLGAKVIRVHDVKATVEAMKMVAAVQGSR